MIPVWRLDTVEKFVALTPGRPQWGTKAIRERVLVLTGPALPLAASVQSTRDFTRIASALIGAQDFETSIAIYTRGSDVLGVLRIADGDPTSVYFGTAMVIEAARLCGATGVAHVHNHPSGNATPSDCDKASARQLDSRCMNAGLDFRGAYVVTPSGDAAHVDVRAREIE